MPENDGRKFRAGVYAKYIEVLLLRYLVSNCDQTIGITKRQLFCLLGFVPTTYNGYSSTGIKSIQRLYITYMPNAIKADASVEVERLKTIKSSKIVTLLNQAIVEGMYRKITNTYRKYNNEETKSKFIYTDEFADIQKRLVDYLVRLNATEIKMVADRIDHKEEN